MKLMKLVEDFHDASKEKYENARLDVEELKRCMDAEAIALEAEYDTEFPLDREAEAQIEGDMVANAFEGGHKVDNIEDKLQSITVGKAEVKTTYGRGFKARRGGGATRGCRGTFAISNATGIASMSDEDGDDDDDKDPDTPANSNFANELEGERSIDDDKDTDNPVNSNFANELESERSINDSEASTEILAPSTPASDGQVGLTAKRRHEHTDSSSSLSSPPSELDNVLDTQSSTPTRARTRKQRKSSVGVALKIGVRTTRTSKPGTGTSSQLLTCQIN